MRTFKTTNRQDSWALPLVSSFVSLIQRFIVFSLLVSNLASQGHPSGPAPGLHSGQSDSPALELTVGVYDYAKTPPSVIRQMKSEFEWIMRKTGVRVAWVPCAGFGQDERSRSCETSLDASALRLRIVNSVVPDQPPQSSRRASAPIGGWTIADGHMITVSLDTPKRLADLQCGYTPPGRILACVLAHEVGHIFLGRGHSPKGIMRTNLTCAVLRQIRATVPTFDTNESERLRDGIRSRATEEQGSKVDKSGANTRESTPMIGP